MQQARVWRGPVWVAVLLALAAGACDRGASDVTGAQVVVEDYFGAFADGRFRVMEGISTGDAALYARYLVAGSRSVNGPAPVAQVRAVEIGDMTLEDDRGRLAGEVVLGEGLAATTFRDFVVERDADRWVLESYLRDGRPLGDYLAPMDGRGYAKVDDAGVSVEAEVAFRDPSAGSVAVPVAILNTGAVEVELVSYQATLTTTAAQRRHPIDFAGPGVVGAGEVVELVLVFDGVDDAGSGGVVELEFTTSTGGTTAMAPALDVPPFDER